jgi:hypothetical protein
MFEAEEEKGGSATRSWDPEADSGVEDVLTRFLA